MTRDVKNLEENTIANKRRFGAIFSRNRLTPIRRATMTTKVGSAVRASVCRTAMKWKTEIRKCVHSRPTIGQGLGIQEAGPLIVTNDVTDGADSILGFHDLIGRLRDLSSVYTRYQNFVGCSSLAQLRVSAAYR